MSVFVLTMPDAVVVVVETALARRSSIAVKPWRMPSWAEADPGTRASHAVTPTRSTTAGRRNYRSPMTATQQGPSPTSISDTTLRSARLATTTLLESGLTP